MARLSASIPEPLKNQLYSVAEENDTPISHIVQAALDTYLNQGGAEVAKKAAEASGGEHLAGMRQEMARLTEQVDSLRREMLTSPRKNPTPRFF